MNTLDRARLILDTPLTMYSPQAELLPLIAELVHLVDALGAHVHPITRKAIIK